VLPLLRAVAITAYREARTLNSIQGNNFFYFALLLSLQPESMGFIWTLLGLIMILPALAAPLARIPTLRLALWPLSKTQVRFLRLFAQPERLSSPWLWRLLPTLELRQLCRTLDFALALFLASSATLYRYFFAGLEADSFPVLSLLVVLALSTLAQNLFGLDGHGGRLRWRLSPRRGYLILARKGLPLILLSIILTVGLDPLAALTGILSALAIGHHFSVFSPLDAAPWRFSMGQFFPYGLLQVFAIFSTGISAARGEYLYLGLAAAAYLLSLFIYGWFLERASLEKI